MLAARRHPIGIPANRSATATTTHRQKALKTRAKRHQVLVHSHTTSSPHSKPSLGACSTAFLGFLRMQGMAQHAQLTAPQQLRVQKFQNRALPYPHPLRASL